MTLRLSNAMWPLGLVTEDAPTMGTIMFVRLP
jgi:hypothetical protein